MGPKVRKPPKPKEEEEDGKKGAFINKVKVKLYVTLTFASIFIIAFSALMFLVPFVIDPSLAAIRADFVEKPVECKVVKSQYVLGVRNCTWSSCREGCTREIYECHHVHVEYKLPVDQNVQDISLNKKRAGLFVNVKGCGYPPDVDCERWIGQFGVNDSTIQCFYSRTNHSFAVTHTYPQEDERNLILATLVPIVCCIVSGSALCILHTKCVPALKSQKEGMAGTGQKRKQIITPSAMIRNHERNERKFDDGNKEKEKAKLLRELSFLIPPRKAPMQAEDITELPTSHTAPDMEDWGRTSSRDNLLSDGFQKRSWRRNYVKTTPA